MNKAIILLVFLLSLLRGEAQTYSTQTTNNALLGRYTDTTGIQPVIGSNTVAFIFRVGDSTLYRFTNTNPQWIKVFTSGGGGGGGGNNIYNVDSSLAGNRTLTLNGHDLSYYYGSRSMYSIWNHADSALHLQNLRLSSDPDSLATASNGFYILRNKTSSLDPRAVDFTMGKYFISNISNGTQPEENVSLGFNLKPSGVQINTAQPAFGQYFSYNHFAASHLHLYERDRYIDSLGNIRDFVFTDIRPDGNVISTTETVSSHQWNGVGNTGSFATYLSAAQNNVTITGVSPQFKLLDTGYSSQYTTITQSGPDCAFTPGRYLNLNGTIHANSIIMNAANVLNLAASTAAFAPVNIAPGVAHTSSFANGDVWNDATNLFIRMAGATIQITNQNLIRYQHTLFTPTTGGTVALINNQYNIINPSGALVALTINLPSSPANNDVVYIKYTQAITTVTYGNGTVVDGITAPTAGGLVVLTYDSGTTSWY